MCERLNFDQLFRMSEPKRIARAATARSKQVPVLDQIDATADDVAYTFKFRCYPSTTGRTHPGYIKFFRPRNPNTPLEKLECELDCGCEDFRFRWAFANKQRGSSRVGPRSLNQAWNRAPRITNSTCRPGLCKHILALRNYLYGKTVHFAGRPKDEEGYIEPSGEEQLQNLVQQINQRAKWRLAQQKSRAAAAAAQPSLAPGMPPQPAAAPGAAPRAAVPPVAPGTRSPATATTVKPGAKVTTTPPDMVPPATGVPTLPKGGLIKTVRPALQKQVAQRFIRPESVSTVVSCMKSLIEEHKILHALLKEVGGEDEGEYDFAAPPTGAAEGEPPEATPPEGELPPEEGAGDLETGGTEVVELLRGILAAVEKLSGTEEPNPEEEEPIIPDDAEEIEGEDELEDEEDEEGEEEDDKELEPAE